MLLLDSISSCDYHLHLRHNNLTIPDMKKGRNPREKPRDNRPELALFLFKSVTQADFAVCYQLKRNLKNGMQKP